MSEKKRRIMLVEDDISLANATKEYLEMHNFEVIVDYGGGEYSQRPTRFCHHRLYVAL